MNYFRLLAHGKAFDPDAFLATTTLRPDEVWRPGEPRPGCEDDENPSCYETGGVAFVLGDGRTVLYPKQEGIALAFIAAHRDELKALGEFPGADHFDLMFHYYREVGWAAELASGTVWASRRLMRYALDIGCELVYTFEVPRRRRPRGP